MSLRFKVRNIIFISVLISAVLLGMVLCRLFLWAGPLGTWQGFLDAGSTRFRVALVLQRDPDGVPIAFFNNLDDGIYNQAFKNFSFGGKSFQGELPTGEKLDLSVGDGGLGNELSGTYVQSHGSFQVPGKISRLALRAGSDYLIPRLGRDGRAVVEFHEKIPEKMADGWETGSVQGSGLDLERLKGGIGKILDGEIPHIHGLVLVQKGRLVMDEYFYGYGPDDKHPVQSITKSVFSLLFGIARDQGLVTSDQKLYSFFPGYHGKPGWDSRKDRMTLRMLLTMRSGFQCDDWKDSQDCSWAMVNSLDWLDFSLSLPLEGTPGRKFAYCGACLTPLSALLMMKSGLDLPSFAGEYLFKPLGIQDTEWMKGPNGITPVSFGLSLRPRDLAKIGQLILAHGIWNGVQVVSEDWIHRSTSAQVLRNRGKDEADYGYLWWVREMDRAGKMIKVIDAWGVGGNHLFIVPDLDLVCVITAGNYKDSQMGAESLDFFRDYVLGR